MGRRLIAAIALLAGPACSSYGTDEPPTAPSVDASPPPGPPADAASGTPPVASDAGSDAASVPDAEAGAPPTNLLSAQESDFEGGPTTQCADGSFTAYRATHVKHEDLAYKGKWSCRICSTSVEPFFTLDGSNIAENPPVGARYHVTARVRIATSMPGGALQRMRIVLRTQNAQKEDVETASSQSTELTAEWTQVSTEIKLTKSAVRVDYYVASDGPNGSCFLADDIVAWKE